MSCWLERCECNMQNIPPLPRVDHGKIAQSWQYVVHKGLLILRGYAWLQRALTRPWTQHTHLSQDALDCPFPCVYCMQVMGDIDCICKCLWPWCEWPADPGSKGSLEVDINWTEGLKWQEEWWWNFDKCWNGRWCNHYFLSPFTLRPHLPCRGLQGK